MTAIRATRAPDGARGHRMGPESVRYATQPMWPGVTWGWDARCLCSWAFGAGGVYQVKTPDALCLNHGRTAERGWFADNVGTVITLMRERAGRAA